MRLLLNESIELRAMSLEQFVKSSRLTAKKHTQSLLSVDRCLLT